MRGRAQARELISAHVDIYTVFYTLCSLAGGCVIKRQGAEDIIRRPAQGPSPVFPQALQASQAHMEKPSVCPSWTHSLSSTRPSKPSLQLTGR